MERDGERIAQSLRGDTRAFGDLVVDHTPALLRFIGSLAPLTAEEREDIAQEAMVRAYEKLAQWDPSRSFPAWVAGFARNVLCEHFARVKRHEEARKNLVGAALAEAALRRVSDPKGAPERRMDALERCVEALPEPMRLVLRKHYCEGLALQTISEALARPLGTIKSILHRSRLEVRNCVARKLLNLPEERPS